MPSRQRFYNCQVIALLIVLAGLPTHAATALEPEVQQAILVREGPLVARLSGVDSKWQITFRTAKETRTVPAADLVVWGAPEEPAGRSYVLLVDGSLLAAEILSSDDEQLHLASDLFGSLSLSLQTVSGIVFHPPLDVRQRDRLLADLRQPDRRREGGAGQGPQEKTPRLNSDQVFLENGDRLSGTIAKIDAGKLSLETQSAPLAVELERIVAIRFNPSLLSAARPRGLYCLVGFSDGSLLSAARLIVDGRQTSLSLVSFIELATTSDAVQFLQPFGGACVYLSDLASESYRHVPFLKLAWPYERDICVSGTRLRAGERLHVKGIGMHSASRLTYRLDKLYRRFAAELAVDDDAVGRGSVVFRVFVDDREAYKSPVIRGGMAPTPISVDVHGGKRLSLIVDFAERGDELDHADWLDARLIK